MLLPVFVASKQLSKVALQLVKESFGELLYEKAMACVKALREEAVKVSDPTVMIRGVVFFSNMHCNLNC